MKHPLTDNEQKRLKPAKDWTRVRNAHLAKHPRCERPELGGEKCNGGVQVHHVTPRGSGGTRGAHGPLITLCLGHHAWAESNRGKAAQLGLLIKRMPSLKGDRA